MSTAPDNRTTYAHAAESTAVRLEQIAERLRTARDDLDDLYCALRDTPLRATRHRRRLIKFQRALNTLSEELNGAAGDAHSTAAPLPY